MNEREVELYLKEFYNDFFIEQIEFNGNDFVWKCCKTTADLDECNHGWKAWQASASRQGYKLVPLEPTDDMYWAAYDRHGDYVGLPNDIYKAMIGSTND